MSAVQPRLREQAFATFPYAPQEAVWRLISRMRIVQSETDEADLLDQLTQPSRATVVSFLNQHALNLAWRRHDFAAALDESGLLLRDGVGLELGLRLNGVSTGLNMNGTDFIPKLLRRYAGRRVALFGTIEPWTSKAADVLKSFGCDVVSYMDGFREHQDYADEVVRVQPELVVLAMGMPEQELVARLIRDVAATPMVIVNGGAIADFIAERFSRAPATVRRLRLEWAFRLVCEPRRLAGRYIMGAPVFALHLLSLRFASAPTLVRMLRDSLDRQSDAFL